MASLVFAIAARSFFFIEHVESMRLFVPLKFFGSNVEDYVLVSIAERAMDN